MIQVVGYAGPNLLDILLILVSHNDLSIYKEKSNNVLVPFEQPAMKGDTRSRLVRLSISISEMSISAASMTESKAASMHLESWAESS